jgi:hypothetical protein
MAGTADAVAARHRRAVHPGAGARSRFVILNWRTISRKYRPPRCVGMPGSRAERTCSARFAADQAPSTTTSREFDAACLIAISG